MNTVILLLALFLSFSLKKVEAKSSAELDKNYFEELKEGFRFIYGSVFAHLIAIFIFIDIAITFASVNLPMFAEVHTDAPSGYLILMFLVVIGRIIGTVIASKIKNKFELSKIFTGLFILSGLARTAFVFMIGINFVLSLVLLVAYASFGAAIGIYFRSLIQKLPPGKIVARVRAIDVSIAACAAALGALLGGLAGSVVQNINMIFYIQAGVYIVAGLVLPMSGRVRALTKIDDMTLPE